MSIDPEPSVYKFLSPPAPLFTDPATILSFPSLTDSFSTFILLHRLTFLFLGFPIHSPEFYPSASSLNSFKIQSLLRLRPRLEYIHSMRTGKLDGNLMISFLARLDCQAGLHPEPCVRSPRRSCEQWMSFPEPVLPLLGTMCFFPLRWGCWRV